MQKKSNHIRIIVQKSAFRRGKNPLPAKRTCLFSTPQFDFCKHEIGFLPRQFQQQRFGKQLRYGTFFDGTGIVRCGKFQLDFGTFGGTFRQLQSFFADTVFEKAIFTGREKSHLGILFAVAAYRYCNIPQTAGEQGIEIQ